MQTSEVSKLLSRLTDAERSNAELRAQLELAQRDARTSAESAFIHAAIDYAEAKRGIEKQAQEYKRALAALIAGEEE